MSIPGNIRYFHVGSWSGAQQMAINEARRILSETEKDGLHMDIGEFTIITTEEIVLAESLARFLAD